MVRIRLGEINDIPAFVNLMNTQYARKKNNDYFLWQYFNSVIQSKIVCAEFENEIIGIFGLQRKVLSNQSFGGQAIDMLIRDGCRGLGIFRKMVDFAESLFKDLDFLFVLPNLNGRNAVESALKWKTIFKINDLVLNRSDFVLNYKMIPEEDSKIFFQSDTSYLQWRFDQNPEYRYHEFKNKNSYIYTKIFIDPVSKAKYGDIVKYEHNQFDTISFYKLLNQAIDFLFKQGVESITTWAQPWNANFNMFIKFGFIEKPKERYFCLNIKNPELDKLYDNKYWIVCQADTEFF